MMTATADAIRIRGLEKTFPGFHLGPLDLNVPKGAIYGLIGANGAGKTTTIDLIMGMGAKEAGEIHVFGFDHIRDEVKMKKRTGYVSPDLNFNAWGTVRRLIGFIRAFYADWDDTYCAELLDRLKIGWTDKIATLSYGSRTKLALIVALAHRPALLLLDEPTAGLDAISKRELFTELLDAVQDEERTVLISSHNLDDLQRFTDHIGILHHGKLLVEGSTADLVERYRMVDCVSRDGQIPKTSDGLIVQHHEGDRWRLLVDNTQHPLENLEAQGLTEITMTPVTLEELFVGLVKDR